MGIFSFFKRKNNAVDDTDIEVNRQKDGEQTSSANSAKSTKSSLTADKTNTEGENKYAIDSLSKKIFDDNIETGNEKESKTQLESTDLQDKQNVKTYLKSENSINEPVVNAQNQKVNVGTDIVSKSFDKNQKKNEETINKKDQIQNKLNNCNSAEQAEKNSSVKSSFHADITKDDQSMEKTAEILKKELINTGIEKVITAPKDKQAQGTQADSQAEESVKLKTKAQTSIESEEQNNTLIEQSDKKTETDAERSAENYKLTDATDRDPIPQNEKKSFFERLKKTRQNISFGLEALIKGKKISEELYEDLETALLTADLGVDTTNEVIEKLRVESKVRELHDASALKDNLKSILKGILKPCEIPLEIEKRAQRPYVILMVGVNGAGKTTTIGKLVEKFKAQKLKVMLAAGDTFRAAAVEQLKAWGERAEVPVVAQETGSDSASVIFDALKSASARSYDVLICDTAGRLQNKDHLMEELKKIVRVMKKNDETVPDEVMLVLDATTGQNAVSQTKLFSEAVQVTGLCITKLDGTAKGGVVFALADKFKIPVRYVGIGEKADDLKTFKVDSFVDALIDE